jgi:hypothetical protein
MTDMGAKVPFHAARDVLESQVADKLGFIVASSAIASPWLLPTLKSFSEVAALLAPILGCVWMGIQIGAKIYYMTKPRRK